MNKNKKTTPIHILKAKTVINKFSKYVLKENEL